MLSGGSRWVLRVELEVRLDDVRYNLVSVWIVVLLLLLGYSDLKRLVYSSTNNASFNVLARYR